jgi:hypothetical protein
LVLDKGRINTVNNKVHSHKIMTKIATLVYRNFANAMMLGIAATTAGILMESIPAHGATLAFSGNLANPNATPFFSFTADGTSTVTIESTSWASGGFDPNLTLFNAAGNWIDERDDIGAGNLDFRYSGILAAGNYQVAIAAFGNNSAGFGTISTPFNGAGDFKGRTSAYAFQIINGNNTTSTAVPEPFTIVGTLIGASTAFRMRKRLKATNKL